MRMDKVWDSVVVGESLTSIAPSFVGLQIKTKKYG